MHLSWLDQTFMLGMGFALSLAGAAGAWWFAWWHSHRTGKQERLNERKKTLYLSVAAMFIDILIEHKKHPDGLTQKQTEELAAKYAMDRDYRLKQLELNLLAPDEVIKGLRWYATTSNDQGAGVLLQYADMLLTMRCDLMGKTTIDRLHLLAVFMQEDIDALRLELEGRS